MEFFNHISNISLNKEEAEEIKTRFKANKSWGKLTKQIPDLARIIDALPLFENYREIPFVHEMILDAICDAKGWNHWQLNNLR